jgi:hypothetical protein
MISVTVEIHGSSPASSCGSEPDKKDRFSQTSRDLQVLRRYIMRNFLLETEYQRAMLETELEWVRAVLDEQGTVDPHGARGVAP